MTRHYPKAMHQRDARALLYDGHPHRLRLWKLSNGEILTYHRAIPIGRYTRGALIRVRLEPSGQIRAFREITLFEIDDIKIYL